MWRLTPPATQLSVKKFDQINNAEYIKAPH